MRRALVAALITSLWLGAGAAATHGAAKPKSFKNCSAMNEVYAHGVGRKNATDKTSGTPVTNFKRSNRIYSYNDGKNRRPGEYDLDRDNDGIACEKR
jgi:hypothetical protein